MSFPHVFVSFPYQKCFLYETWGKLEALVALLMGYVLLRFVDGGIAKKGD
jgi:hypothetical protein